MTFRLLYQINNLKKGGENSRLTATSNLCKTINKNQIIIIKK